MEITGVVQRIVYRNADNGYTVLTLLEEEKETEFTACGILPLAAPGERLHLNGALKFHPRYGQQFAVAKAETLAPSSLAAMEAYLMSGSVKGVGPSMAKLIVSHFGMDTFRVLEEEPQKLIRIPGIGPKKCAMISASFHENRTMRDILVALEPYGITVNQAYRLYKIYGELALAKIQENPYQLIDDVEGVGFITADSIAQRVAGFETTSAARLFAGIRYALQSARTEYGHTFLPKDKLILKSASLLGVEQQLLTEAVDAMIEEGSLSLQIVGKEEGVFLPYLARMEQSIAQKLLLLTEQPVINPFWDVDKYQQELGITLSESQKQAVQQALDSGVLVITGGPGTGKTTIIRFITYALTEAGMTFALAAPTGRAAKRMTEATGADASTIHRLLEYNPAEGFVRNRENPLFVDMLIVDEMSMVDVPLMFALLDAVPRGTRLILVGDADQLPPVGCGDVLRDALISNVLPVIRLTEIFRQAQSSRIITNAHRINEGHMPVLEATDSDFLFEEILPPEIVLRRVTDLCLKEYGKLGTGDPLMDVQVLAPMKKGMLGVENLNKVLQEALNPPALSKPEHLFGSVLFRQGDKIMQIKNDYKVEWQKVQRDGTLLEGVGAFNGDLGTLYRLDTLNRILFVLFDDGRLAQYDYAQSDELDLAYCISIHKSQGSEFPTVLLPLAGGPPMLLTRNLLYTAVTRAKRLVYCIGRRDTVARMVATVQSRRRFTSLACRLIEAKEAL